MTTDTPNRPPLWLVMERATGTVAEWDKVIEAVRDWLVPEESIENAPGRFVNGCCLEDRQRLRALLTTEADRAERGDHD